MDTEIADYKDRLKEYKIKPDCSILCDVSTLYPRPFVPSCLRKAVFESLQSISHSGIHKFAKLIKSKIFLA